MTTPFRGVVCFPSVRLPDFIRHSDEVRRRVHEARLHRKLPNWMKSSGGDTTEWRKRSERNARIANSILTHAWRSCRQQDFLFEHVAEALGLNQLQPPDQAIGVEHYQALYRHCRNEDGKRQLLNDTTFVRGWVDLDSPEAKRLIAPLLPETEGSDSRKARHILRTNLEAMSWNDVLGIEDPPIRLEIKIHGSRWGGRFIADEPAMKGQERINEQLPPIPGKDGDAEPLGTATSVDAVTPPLPPATTESANVPAWPPEGSTAHAHAEVPTTGPGEAAEALRKAGLPT